LKAELTERIQLLLGIIVLGAKINSCMAGWAME